MNKSTNQFVFRSFLLALCISSAAAAVFAQGTAFTYQGRLQEGGSSATGNYDFQFTLWDALSGGTQQPQPSPVTVTRSGVAVANGVFTVQLDFGASAFPSADRFLEIGVRPYGGGAYTLLSPRQPIGSMPYAIRALNTTAADSLSSACSNCVQSTQINSVAGTKVVGIVANATDATNASQLGGVPANNYVLTSDSRLSDSRPPAPGSSNYIQNTTSTQASSSFNVSGDSNVNGTLHVGGTLLAGCNQQCIPIIFNDPFPNPKLTVLGHAQFAGNSLFSGNSLFNTSGTNGVRITPANDADIGVLNVTNAANTINWLTVGNNGQVIMNNSGADPKVAITGNVKVTNGLYETNAVASGSSTVPTCWTTNFASAPYVLGLCSSSLRYKTKVRSFAGGLDLINRLHPITFTWKRGGVRDIGLGAEDVEQIEPLLTFRNTKGEIEGVRYDLVTVVLVNAVKQQQALIVDQRKQLQQEEEQIKRQEEQIKRQEGEATQQRAALVTQAQELKALKNLVCRFHRRATVCK
jgi:hypothetical protein